MDTNIIRQLASMSPTEARGRAKKPNDTLYTALTQLTDFLPTTASPSQRLWHVRHDIYKIPSCSMCDCAVRWTTKRTPDHPLPHYTTHCSNRCRALDPSVNAKRKSTAIERHGHDTTLSTAEHAEKTRASHKARTGAEFPLQTTRGRANAEQAMLTKYGCHQNRINSRGRLVEMYGDVSFGEMFATDPFRGAAARAKHAVWFPQRLHQIQKDVRLVSEQTKYENRFTLLTWSCVHCGNVFEDCLRDGQTPRCQVCFPMRSTNWNQQELVEFVRASYNGPVITNTRSVIAPKELDVWMPELNLAIEYNGLYWHSEERLPNAKTYHLDKTEACEQKGIRLLHVFEDEWVNQRTIIQSILVSALHGPRRKVGARRCIAKPLTHAESNAFLERNHLQGGDRSSVRYGLFENGEIVAAMTFGSSRYDKARQWELLRYAQAVNTAVIGGAQRLLSTFITEHQPQSIVTYSDRRLFSGDIYSSLGFTYVGTSAPGYYYVHHSNCRERLSRQLFQKHMLAGKLPSFDPQLSEVDNMAAAGYFRIWNCGNRKWVWDANV